MAIVRHIVINMLNKAKGAFNGVGIVTSHSNLHPSSLAN